TLTPLDPTNAAFRADPFPVFRRLRLEDPVHRSEAVGGWVLTRYADVQNVLRDARLSSDRITPFFDNLDPEHRPATRELGDFLRKGAVFPDPPKAPPPARAFQQGLHIARHRAFAPRNRADRA